MTAPTPIEAPEGFTVPRFGIPPEPVKREVWLSAYDNDTVMSFRNKDAAMHFQSDAKLVACVRVEFMEGQFDE